MWLLQCDEPAGQEKVGVGYCSRQDVIHKSAHRFAGALVIQSRCSYMFVRPPAQPRLYCVFYEGVSRWRLVWFCQVCTASCGCPLLGCSLFWFLGVAGLILPPPYNNINSGVAWSSDLVIIRAHGPPRPRGAGHACEYHPAQHRHMYIICCLAQSGIY